LLMSILAKHRYQTHASIVELAVKLGLAEGLGSSIRWTFSHGYGSLIVNFSGWPLTVFAKLSAICSRGRDSSQITQRVGD
jgi:hypothetical protein